MKRLFILVLLIAACGKQDEQVTEQPKVAAQPPTISAATDDNFCDTVDAAFCDDSGVTTGRYSSPSQTTFAALFSKFTPSTTQSNSYGRLIELGGDSSFDGGMALTVSGSLLTSNLKVECAWWNGVAVSAFGYDLTAGEHSAYCEVSNSQARLFVDGALVRTQSATYYSTVSNLGVGVAANSSAFDFYGSIDTAAAFTTPLTDTEIEDLF